MWLWSSNQAFGHLGCPSLIILFFLREDKMRKKLFLALIALTACCGYGCAEDEGGATCTDGERRCYGEHSQVCKDGAYTTEKCTMGCDAVSGKCNTSPATPEICDDGKFQCADGKLEKCVSNAWVKQEECPADRCDATAGKCNPAADKVCDDGKFQCADGKLNKCVSNAWVKQEECPADRCDATAGKCNTDNPPADKCTNDTFKCENEKLYKCENESWNAGTACPDAKCNAETGMCDEEQPQLEKCTATSTKKCEATCNADKKGGYYWGGAEIVTITGCNNGNPCTVSSDNGYVACKDKLLTRCTATSSAKCHMSCDPDGSKGYYWDNGLNTVSCTGNNKCVINADRRVSCESDTKVSCATLAADMKDKYTCESDNMVKFCNSKTDTYWNIDCDGCSVSGIGKHYYCNPNKKACTAESKSACIPNCISENKYYQWQGGKNPKVILTTCKRDKPYCQEEATSAKCAANP